jgi:sugar phosphate permease
VNRKIQTANLICRSRLINAFPVYYGWVILAVGAVGGIMSSPGQTYSIAAFIDSFIFDLGISRSLVSTLYTAGTLTASFALPFVGRQLDRRGSRFIIVMVSFFLGVSCIYMGAIQNAVMLFIGFLALRFLGQGSLSLVSTYAINQWWVRRRGMAMGIAGMAAALIGAGGFPNLINWLIPVYGWRIAYMLLGLGVLIGMMPLGLVFIRNRPEDFGLHPDGSISAAADKDAAAGDPVEEHWTLSEAIGTSTFWIVSAGLSSGSMLSTGLTFHLFSIFKDSGLSSTVAASVFLPIAVTSGIMHLGGGILVDRMPIRVILAISLFFQTLALIMAPYLCSVELALAFGLIMGIRGGLQMIVSNVIWAKFFGRMYLGSISGVTATLMVASSALGPMPFGVARDILGSYTAVLIGFAGLPFILAVATLFYCRPPVRR